eukprot:761471-Hanusia_phi.AAC.3
MDALQCKYSRCCLDHPGLCALLPHFVRSEVMISGGVTNSAVEKDYDMEEDEMLEEDPGAELRRQCMAYAQSITTVKSETFWKGDTSKRLRAPAAAREGRAERAEAGVQVDKQVLAVESELLKPRGCRLSEVER